MLDLLWSFFRLRCFLRLSDFFCHLLISLWSFRGSVLLNILFALYPIFALNYILTFITLHILRPLQNSFLLLPIFLPYLCQLLIDQFLSLLIALAILTRHLNHLLRPHFLLFGACIFFRNFPYTTLQSHIPICIGHNRWLKRCQLTSQQFHISSNLIAFLLQFLDQIYNFYLKLLSLRGYFFILL